ncbi:MAG: hypothetical protein HKM02_00525 [Pseudomonadales bacterium]|nr:hypothetical protein [Pseudomonadales bacterium]
MNPEKRIRRRQWLQVIVIVSVLMILVVLGLYWSDRSHVGSHAGQSVSGPVGGVYTMPLDTINPEQTWMSKGEHHLGELDERQRHLESLISTLSSAGATITQNPAAEAPAPAPALPQHIPGLGAMPLPGNRPVPELTSPAMMQPEPAVPKPDLDQGVATPAPPEGIEDTEVTPAEKTDVPMPDLQHTVDSYLPAGSFAKVVLLSGFDAPTGGQATQNALPLVMRVKSFMRLPNLYKSNLKECFITGSGYGDLASERAYIRTEHLSCVLKNGHVLEKKIKGHVLGEDASFGLRGKVISKQGALIAKSFFAGLFSGIGNSIAMQSQTLQSSPLGTVSTVDPSRTMQAGLGGGMSTSTNKIADFYLQQANQIFPIIEISAMRVGEVFLVDGVNFSEKDQQHVMAD